MNIVILVITILSMAFTDLARASHDGQEDVCHNATVIFCDNFEGRAAGSGDLRRATYKNRGWENLSSHQVTQDSISAFSGAKGFTVYYPAGSNTGLGYLLGYFADASGNSVSAPEIYVRWYEKWSTNFVYSQISNKNIKAGEISGNDIHLYRHESPGGVALHTVVGGITPSWWTAGAGPNQPDTYHLFQLYNAAPFTLGQWYCLEARVRTNTNGSTFDGVVESWVNGQRVMQYTGLNIQRQNLVPPTNRQYSHIWIDGYWNCSGGATQGPGNACTPANAASTHPAQQRYHDNFVVSTSPIGCIGGVPPTPGVDLPPPPPQIDTNPPNAPTNLNVTELWNDLKQFVATIWSWLGPASAEAAVPNDKLTLSWTSQDRDIEYDLRWQYFAHSDWINLGLVNSMVLQLVTSFTPPIECQAGQDCWVCADARAKRKSDGAYGVWLSETPAGKVCNQFAVGPIVLPPPPDPVPVPTVDTFKNILETNTKLSFQYAPVDCPKGITKSTSTTKNGLRTVTLTCAK